MRTTPLPPPAARVGDAPRSASPSPPGASPGDFAALLDQTTARTAQAEGPQTRPARDAQPRDRRDDAPSGDDGDAPAAAADAAPQASTAQPATPAGATAAGAGGAPDPAAQDAPPTLYTAVDPTALGAAGPAPAEPVVVAAAVTTTAAPATPGAPATGAPVLRADSNAPALDAVDPDAAPATAAGLVLPAELLGGAGTGTDAQAQDGKDAPDLAGLAKLLQGARPAGDPAAAATPAADAAPAASPVSPPAADAPIAAAPAPAPAPSPAAIAQPAATPITAVPVAQGTPQLTRASVDAAVDRVQDLVRIAAHRAGGARATMQLKPVELGTVDVHLRTTREGLVATIAAHDQAGLEALQQAGGELRRTLEDRGVNVARLDLQLSAGQSGLGNGADARQASAEAGRGRALGRIGTDEDDAVDDELTVTTVASTPAGALVDVQA